MNAPGALPIKPRLRGVSHEYAFFVSVGCGVALILAASDGRARFAAIVYAFAVSALLGTSALYHRVTWRPQARRWMRRLDHSMIFVMIAGTYTPFALNVLPHAEGRNLCAAAWCLAALGVALKLLWPRRLERLSLALYLGMGWMGLSVVRSLMALMPETVMVLLLLGGIAYSVGSVVHSLRRVPFQNAVWHLLVLLGAGLHLAALSLEFRPPA